MKYTQNERIMQITEKTLIIGIDVGSEKHHARAFNFRGVEYGKLLIFHNDAEGFAMLEGWIRKLSEQNGFKDVTVGWNLRGTIGSTLASI
jgi:transposase